MKIAVYAIAKNEQHNVQDWFESVKSADGVFVLDTGSTDETVEQLEALGVTVTRMHAQKNFRFDHARNEAASLVPEDFDVLVSLDFDERLSPDWYEEIANNFRTDVADYTLVYEHDALGNITMSYPRCAVHKRDCATWQYPVHELLIPVGNSTKQKLNFYCVHYGTTKPRGHYLSLLRLAHEERPEDARTTGYLAREYYGLGNFGMAIPLYEKYLELEEYAPFRSEAATFLANMMPDFVRQEWWHRQAVQYCNNAREPYCNMATFYFQKGMFEHVIAYVKSAQEIERPEYDMIFTDRFYEGPWCDWMLMSAYQRSGNIRQAVNKMEQIQSKYTGQITRDLESDMKQVVRSQKEAYYVFVDSMGLQGRRGPGFEQLAETPEQEGIPSST